jgi:hypothetical protein
MADFVTRTSACTEHRHPEFRLAYNNDLVTEDDVRTLIEDLERRVAQGERFADGAAYQIGWVAARVRAVDDQTLAIFEPDMTHTPEWWIESVNHSLIHRRLQLAVGASVEGIGGVQFPSSEDSAWVFDCFGNTDGLAMQRFVHDEDQSGWSFTCDSPDHDHGDESLRSQKSLFEVAVGVDPRVIPYLALPPGVTVTVRAAGPSFFLDDHPAGIKPGSLVDRNFPGAARQRD